LTQFVLFHRQHSDLSAHFTFYVGRVSITLRIMYNSKDMSNLKQEASVTFLIAFFCWSQ